MSSLRYEYKMVTEQTPLSEILSIIHRHKAMFKTHHPSRIVNNIYFDTPSFTCYADHISGSLQREKNRIRWYGSPSETIERPVFERKIKQGLVGKKISEVLPVLKINSSTPWPIPEKLVDGNGNGLHWRLRNVKPVLALRYTRHYFISGDQHYRLTVDTKLESFALSSKGHAINRSIKPAPTIIELKFNRENSNGADEITNAFPFRINRFSKYLFAFEGLKIGS
jgi:SPX domain protein involved in polyphosphate accumulation